MAMDLIRDFKEILLKHGRKQGLIFSDFDSDSTCIRILSFNRKIGLGNKKKVSFAKGIRIPKEYKKRVYHILEYLADGGNIIPYLSKQSINLNNPGDLMFNDWNILHIHLGKRKDKKDPRFIERTGELLFLINTETEIRVLGVYDHKPSPWTRKELLQRIYDTWPEMLYVYSEIFNINPSIEGKRQDVRKEHMLVLDQVYDKRMHRQRFVMVKGSLGLVSSGDSIIDVNLYDRACDFLRMMEMDIWEKMFSTTANLYEGHAGWIIKIQNSKDIYWLGEFVKLNKVHKL